jgi:hypothetical protein
MRKPASGMLVSAVTTGTLLEMPARVDRATAAAVVTRHFFPISSRTLERWPLPTRIVNGKAVIETAELLAVAQSKLDAAPLVRNKAA